MPMLPTLAESPRLRYATFFYLYFMQGVPSGFALTALANYLTAHGISSVMLGSYVSIIGIPWIIQLVWGPLIDRYRYSVVGHYKHWVVLTQVVALAASFILLIVQRPEQQVWLLAFLFFAHSIVASVQDASVDAMAILITPVEERGRVNAFMRGGILLGGAFGAAVLSIVLHNGGYQIAVLVQSGILLFFTLLFFITKLHRTDPLLPQFKNVKKDMEASTEEPKLMTVFRQLGTALTRQRSLRIFGVISLSYLFFSVFGTSLGFYLIRTLKWPDQELSVLTGGWGSLVTLFVIMTSGVLADKLGASRLQRVVITVLAVFLVLFSMALFIITAKPAITAGLLFWSIADPLYSVAAFPILMTLCRKDIAGSQFTAYMALINFAGIGGGYASGWLLTLVPGPVLGVTSGVGLLVLAFLLFRYKRQLEPVEDKLQLAVVG
jgi:MFS transporter, PAT family, beta-lactamase induction signal transducer AmpG